MCGSKGILQSHQSLSSVEILPETPGCCDLFPVIETRVNSLPSEDQRFLKQS